MVSTAMYVMIGAGCTIGLLTSIPEQQWSENKIATPIIAVVMGVVWPATITALVVGILMKYGNSSDQKPNERATE